MNIPKSIVPAVCAFIIAACGASSAHEPRVESLSASYLNRYPDLASLSSGAELIVVGRVSTQMSGERRHPADQRAVLLYTDSTVEVQSVIKGGSLPGAITVHQTGGKTPALVQEIEEDPLMEPGATYVLFLAKDPASHAYYVIGGPRGRFVVDRGVVMPLSRVYPSKRIPDLGTEPLPLDQFKQEAAP